MRVIATKVLAKDLKPGELFSIEGPDWWDHIDEFNAVGQKVYLRTNADANHAPDAEVEVFRLQVVQEGEDDASTR